MPTSMRKSKKLQITFSEVLLSRIAAYAERSGLTVNQSIIAILNGAIQLNTSTTCSTTTTAPKIPISTLRANLKGVRDSIAAKHEQKTMIEQKGFTITFAQQDDLYNLYEKAAQLKHQLGELMDTTPEEVMRAHYARELDMLNHQHEAEADDLFNPLATPEFHKLYKERAERINTLKDRLK